MQVYLKLYQTSLDLNMSKTKEQIIAQVNKNTWAIKSLKNKTEDINALWHWCKCLEEDNKKLQQEIDRLHEEINKINVERHEK